MAKNAKGRRSLRMTFDRDIPEILLQEIVWQYLPGRAPHMFGEADPQIDHEANRKQLAERLSALGVLLGVGTDAWKKRPEVVLLRLAEAVFPGFRYLFKGEHARRSAGSESDLNPTLLRWYQRSVELRQQGLGKQAALIKAATGILDSSHPPSVLAKWRRVKNRGFISIFEQLIKSKGLTGAAEQIRSFPVHLFDSNPAGEAQRTK